VFGIHVFDIHERVHASATVLRIAAVVRVNHKIAFTECASHAGRVGHELPTDGFRVETFAAFEVGDRRTDS
jgi:hypothetical protein